MPFRVAPRSVYLPEETDTAHVARSRGTFLEEVVEATPGGEQLVHCLQCGRAAARAPAGPTWSYPTHPLRPHRRRPAGAAILSANTMWACVSCYFCTTRCPQKIPITDIMYTLKRLSIAERLYHKTDAPALAKAFTDYVDKYGRQLRTRPGHELPPAAAGRSA